MKIGIKRSLLFFLCALVALLSVGCNGTYVPGNKPTQDPSGGDSSGGNPPGITVDENVFTVTLNSPEPLSAFELRSMKAKWTNTESNNGASYVASFNDDGVAEISGLDGEYRVTLSGLPDGFTYNPNIHLTNNDDRDITVRLYKLIALDSSVFGLDWYNDIHMIKEPGAYRATLTEKNFEDGIRFRYEPGYAGDYSIESIIDITENKVNPYLSLHNGSKVWTNPEPYSTMDGGGEENTYTKNFRWEISIIHIGNVFNFRIFATTLDEGVFPVNVDFILDRDGEFSDDEGSYDVIEVTAKHDFEAAKETAFEGISGRFTYFAYYGSNNGLLNGNLVKLFDDGYYYVVDENGEKYKRLYARIGKDCECMSTDNDSGLLFPMVRLNKLLVYDSETQTEKCYNYTRFIREQYGENLYQGDTYPVTEELKLFLQRYSVSQRFFNDGNGIAENTYSDTGVSTPLYRSTETNQWLWACGYYA